MKKKLYASIVSVLTVLMLSSCTLFKMVNDMKTLAEVYDNISYEVMDALPDSPSDFKDGMSADGKWRLYSSASDDVLSFGLVEGEVISAGEFTYTEMDVKAERKVVIDPVKGPVFTDDMSFDTNYRKGNSSNSLSIANSTETVLTGTYKEKKVEEHTEKETAHLYEDVKLNTHESGYAYENVSSTLSKYTYVKEGADGWNITAMETMTKCVMTVNGSDYDLLKLL